MPTISARIPDDNEQALEEVAALVDDSLSAVANTLTHSVSNPRIQSSVTDRCVANPSDGGCTTVLCVPREYHTI